MPAVSKAQQRFFGMVRSAQKGKMKNPSSEVLDVADDISVKDAKKFAKTKHKGLPEKKKMKEQTMRDPSLIEINQCSVLYGGTDYMKAVTYDQQEDDVVLVETFTEDQIIQQAYEKAKKNNLVIDLS